MKNPLILTLLLFASHLFGKTYTVGPSKTYVSPNALYLADVIQDGDTILIDAFDYKGQASLAVWSKNNLYIKGIGSKPHMIADGKYIWGKGIWVCAGNNISIVNISFSGAKVPDKNGAGIRLDGIGIQVRHCSFLNNENGILTSNPYDGDIVIEYSEFSQNGFGDGFSHNLYIGHVNKLIFRFNYSHHAKIGHNLKSRAKENIILYNRIMDEAIGNSSRLIDLSNGGYAIIMGNLLMQGPNAENNNLIGYGKEGLDNTAKNELYVVNNTMVNKRTASCIFVDINDFTSYSSVSNNIFTGTGTITKGQLNEFLNNLIEPIINKLDFKDEPIYDYRLKMNSPAIDYGATTSTKEGLLLMPDSMYLHPISFGIRKIVNNIIDVGAYEFGEQISLQINFPSEIKVYPNPTSGLINIPENYQLIKITDINGINQLLNNDKHDLSKLIPGSYILFLQNNGLTYTQKLLKF